MPLQHHAWGVRKAPPPQKPHRSQCSARRRNPAGVRRVPCAAGPPPPPPPPQLVELDASAVAKYRPYVPALCRILRALLVPGFSPEHDIGGITNPFLQASPGRGRGGAGRGIWGALSRAHDESAQGHGRRSGRAAAPGLPMAPAAERLTARPQVASGRRRHPSGLGACGTCGTCCCPRAALNEALNTHTHTAGQDPAPAAPAGQGTRRVQRRHERHPGTGACACMHGSGVARMLKPDGPHRYAQEARQAGCGQPSRCVWVSGIPCIGGKGCRCCKALNATLVVKSLNPTTLKSLHGCTHPVVVVVVVGWGGTPCCASVLSLPLQPPMGLRGCRLCRVQVAANVEGARNAGNAILYEAVQVRGDGAPAP
jgi:hypothetical protein